MGFFSDFFGGGPAGLRLAELLLLAFLALSIVVFALAVKPYAQERRSS